jgi:hypothetical protein
MANSLLRDRGGGAVGKHWAQRFVASETRLKTRVNRMYDYSRALCEDPDVINGWFDLVSNTRAKYGILDGDTYNFDETGFMMGVGAPKTVVTGADKRGQAKSIQPGNRQWATGIELISGDGWVGPPTLIVKAKVHLASWYTEGGIPDDWIIETSPNG